MTTLKETVAIPSCEFVDETFAASIFGWTMQQLHYQQSYNSFAIPIRHGQMLIIPTDQIVIWARNRSYAVTRYSI